MNSTSLPPSPALSSRDLPSPRHLVRRQVLEVAAPTEGEARVLQDALASIHQRRLEPILDRCFTAHAPAGTFQRIDTLNVDLGSLDPQNLERDLAQALELALRQALAEVGTAPDLGGDFFSPEAALQGSPIPTDARNSMDGRNPRPEASNTSDSVDADSADPTVDAALELLTLFLLTGRLPWWAETRDPDQVSQSLELLLSEDSSSLRHTLRRLASSPVALPRLVRCCEDTLLADLFRLLSGSGSSVHVTDRARAWIALVDGPWPRVQVWAMLLRCASDVSPETESDPVGIWRRAAARLRFGSPSTHESIDPDPSSQFLRSGSSRPRSTETEVLSKASVSFPSEEGGALGSNASLPDTPPSLLFSDPDFPETSLPTPMDLQEEDFCVENAGLVLLWPFLPHFFERLELFVHGRFVDDAARHRAAGLLHHLASGVSAPVEYQVTLAKVLVGLDLDAVFDFGPEVTPEESEECGSLIEAVVGHAPLFKNLSVDGFRGSYLLRSGILRVDHGAWLLHVERASYDVLVDRLPWSFEWVRLPWMDEPMRVQW